MTAIMTAIAVAGFYGSVEAPRGHWEQRAYPSFKRCNDARPGVEADMRARGYSGISTVCRAVKEGGI